MLRFIKFISICITIITINSFNSFAQYDLKSPLGFRGNLSITNNGISLIPSFSLSKPAVQFDLKVKKNKFSFEPDMRFALEGKPWSFIFWFRYQLINNDKFSLRLGAHPALNFRTVTIIRNGLNDDLIESRRFLAAEIVPSYKINDHLSVDLYYLQGRGFDEGLRRSHFFTVNASLSNIKLFKDFYFNASPQAYYLQTDELKGYYVVGFFEIAKKEFPLSIASIVNKAIETEIAPNKDFIWNLSLVYKL